LIDLRRQRELYSLQKHGLRRRVPRGLLLRGREHARHPCWQLESAMNKTTTFEHGGKVYEVRAIPTLNGWKVRIFVEGIPANGFTYFSRLRSLSRCCDRRSARRFGGRADGNSGA